MSALKDYIKNQITDCNDTMLNLFNNGVAINDNNNIELNDCRVKLEVLKEIDMICKQRGRY